MQPASSCAKRP